MFVVSFVDGRFSFPLPAVIHCASMKFSPTSAGWRTIWRDPAIALAEISWRWMFGLISALVVVFSFLVYLSTIPVPGPLLWMMDTRRAALAGGTLAQMLHGSGRAATKLVLAGLPPLAALWIVLASLGRTATIRAMVSPAAERGSWRRMLGISFLRFVTWFAGNVALYGALILAAMASVGSRKSVGAAVLIFFSLGIVIFSTWSLLNWLLTLASIYVVRGEDTFGAIGRAVDLACRRFGALLATTSVWGILRSVVFLAAAVGALATVALVRTIPPGYVVIAILLITLGYLAVADCFYVARLASYVTIVEADLELPPAVPASPEPPCAPDIPPLLPDVPAEI